MSNSTTRKFLARLSCSGDSNDRAAHVLHVSPVATSVQSDARYAVLDALPFHPEADVSSGTAADCHLQLWELDYYKTSNYMLDEETDLNAHENRRLISIPGVVVKTSGGEYRFRILSDPDGGTVDPTDGKVRLSLEKAGETNPSQVTVAVPEFESVLELYPILREQADNDAIQSYRDASAYQVRNIEASLRRQIKARGGFAAAFVVDFGPNPPPNNAEFARQAEEMIPTLPTFKLVGGEVMMGYHLWSSFEELGPVLTALRSAVKDLLGLDAPPPVATLALYGHGLRQKLLIDATGGYNAPGSLRVDRVPHFVDVVQPHLCDSPVIALFACNTGAAPNPPNPDNRYGRAHPCEEMGADSLAWTLTRELIRKGVQNPTVWAHTTAAHTTRNPRLRVYSSLGTSDFVNLLFESPRLKDATIASYVSAVTPLEQFTSAQAALYRQRLHNANLIRRISLQHAMYLPWGWTGNASDPSACAGYTEEAKTEARAVYDELRALVASPQSDDEDVTWEDDTRAFITGLRSGVSAPLLSQNFSYGEIQPLADPMRVSAVLLKRLQLLRYRSGKGLSPRTLLDDGTTIAVRANPDTAQARSAVLNAANQLVTEGLLSAAALDGGLIRISVAT